MAELKTKETKSSVSAFLMAIPDKQRHEDALAVAAMMKAVTKIGKSGLHIQKLSEVDAKVLKQLITRSLRAPLPGA